MFTVLNTPFTEADTVDHDALARHAVSALDAGVVGFLVPAIAAEVAKLTDEERLGMVSAVVGAIGRRVPVIAGASAASQAERLKNAGRLTALGCDIVLVSQPYTSEEQYIRRLARSPAHRASR